MKHNSKDKKKKAAVTPKKAKTPVKSNPKAKATATAKVKVKVKEPVKKVLKLEKKPALIKNAVPEVKEIKKPQAPIVIPFSIGDYAVYPAHGVGRIEAVESKSIMDEKMDFLVINILDTGMNVLVPVKNIQNVGLRQVIKGSRVKDVYDVLKEKKRSVMGPTWNRRYREYMEKIKSGSVFEIAEVLRDLIVLKKEKELSFGERKMLDTAKTLLMKEIALAKGVNEKKIEAEMLKIFSEL